MSEFVQGRIHIVRAKINYIVPVLGLAKRMVLRHVFLVWVVVKVYSL
jgi:hypothetical protein